MKSVNWTPALAAFWRGLRSAVAFAAASVVPVALNQSWSPEVVSEVVLIGSVVLALDKYFREKAKVKAN